MSRVQKRQLLAYLHFRNREMSVGALLLFNWRIFALTALLGFGTVLVMFLVVSPFWAWLFAAAYGAIFLRDVGLCIRWWRVWPMTRDLLDWTRVEHLAREHGLAA